LDALESFRFNKYFGHPAASFTMTSSVPSPSGNSPDPGDRQIVIRCDGVTIRTHPSTWFRRFFTGILAGSLLLNAWYIWQPFAYRRPRIPEQHLLGTAGSNERIAIVNFEGTISPPFTSRWIRTTILFEAWCL
jgi:hypothetical protein